MFLCNIIFIVFLKLKLFSKLIVGEKFERLKLTQDCDDNGKKIAASEVTLGKVHCP